jgi:CHAD domain-containing protein
MRDFGLAKTASLVHGTADAVRAAARTPNPEAIHRMRVSIRRLQQSIRLFRQFLRRKGVHSVRADLRRIMEPAGELRNFDIAVGLVRRAGGCAELLQERRVTARLVLQGQLSDLGGTNLGQRWLDQLGIQSEKDLES